MEIQQIDIGLADPELGIIPQHQMIPKKLIDQVDLLIDLSYFE